MPAAGLQDVARIAGVSLSTASRALSPEATHPVNPATRERVVEAAQSLQYQPNLMARGLRSRRLPTIAVVVHDVTDAYFAEMVRGAEDEAYRHGFLTFVCSSHRDPAAELRYVEMLRLSRVSAVIFAAGGLIDAGYQRAMKEQVEAIRAYGGAVVSLAPRVERWPTEVADNPGGARLMTDHLIGLGHRQIAFITGPENVATSAEREAGYQLAMKAAGLKPLVERGDFSPAGGGRATARLLKRDRSFTALFVSSDTMAIGALAELHRQGVRVPQDLSVGGFGDILTWEFANPALTTIRVDLAGIGAAGVRRALDQVAGRDTAPRVHVHQVSLVTRESTQQLQRPVAALA